MYESHFGLHQRPFNLCPDPHYFYLGATHGHPFNTMLQWVHGRSPTLALVGQAGTGKTALVRRFAVELDSESPPLLLQYTTLGLDDLLEAFADELGIAGLGETRLARFEAIRAALQQKRDDRECALLLIVDEAQNLSAESLHTLLLLAHDSAGSNAARMLFVAQADLVETIALLPPLPTGPWIDAWLELECLKAEEIEPYVRHRIGVAGADRHDIFSGEASQCLYAHTHGNPRLLNLLCDKALVAAHCLGQQAISAAIVDSVAQVLSGAHSAESIPDLTKLGTVPVSGPMPEHGSGPGGAERAGCVAAMEQSAAQAPHDHQCSETADSSQGQKALRGAGNVHSSSRRRVFEKVAPRIRRRGAKPALHGRSKVRSARAVLVVIAVSMLVLAVSLPGMPEHGDADLRATSGAVALPGLKEKVAELSSTIDRMSEQEKQLQEEVAALRLERQIMRQRLRGMTVAGGGSEQTLSAASGGSGGSIDSESVSVSLSGQLVSYRVEQGDTLFGIARRHGVTVNQLVQWNDISPDTVLQVGSRLVVSSSSMSDLNFTPLPAASPKDAIYTVQPGDTLYSIARRFSVSVPELGRWNELLQGDPLVVGQRLVVQHPRPSSLM